MTPEERAVEIFSALGAMTMKMMNDGLLTEAEIKGEIKSRIVQEVMKAIQAAQRDAFEEAAEIADTVALDEKRSDDPYDKGWTRAGILIRTKILEKAADLMAGR